MLAYVEFVCDLLSCQKVSSENNFSAKTVLQSGQKSTETPKGKTSRQIHEGLTIKQKR